VIEQILNYLTVGIFLGGFLGFLCFAIYALARLWIDDTDKKGGPPPTGSGPFGSYSGGEWGE
jgi:hypothetical protein